MPSSLCAICRAPLTETKFLPFCSSRCSLVDLNHWLSGAYAIPETPESPLPPSSESTVKNEK